MAVRWLTLLAGLIFAGLAIGDDSLVDRESFVGPPMMNRSEYMTERFIVEFSKEGATKLRKRDGSIDTSDFISQVSDVIGQEAKPVLTFDSSIFQGVSMDLAGASNGTLQSIGDLPAVQSIWPAGKLTIPSMSEAQVVDNVYANWTYHNYTKVNEAHKNGYKGKGIVVAIVDSGIDYKHPALGGGYGPGFKVEGGWDIAGDDYVSGGQPNPDPDPMDCHGHGTHVAGIVAGLNDRYTGVAPEARLRIYKVFGCGDGSGEDVVLAGFLRAYEEGADIINSSLGSIVGFPYMALTLVVSRIQAAGVFFAASAGNSGSLGPFFITNVGNGFDITTVASVDQNDRPIYTVTAHSSDGTSRIIPYIDSTNQPWDRKGKIRATFDNDTRTRNNCDYLSHHPKPENPDDILLLKRGDCFWLGMDDHLWDGVKWAFWYNHPDGAWEVPNRFIQDASRQAIGFAVISHGDGEWLLSQYEQNRTVEYEFITPAPYVSVPISDANGVRSSSFSSFGPTLDARMKPEISAPGRNILSTYIGGKWATLSGTSMSSPYIAGVAALYMGAHGGRAQHGDEAGAITRRRILASAQRIPRDNAANSHELVMKAGAGLVDAMRVLEYKTNISPPILHLNETAYFKKDHVISITNTGDEAVTYQIRHRPLNTAILREVGQFEIRNDPLIFGGEGWEAKVTLPVTNVTVGAGETKQFPVSFAEPEPPSVGASFFIYSGSIDIIGDNQEDVVSTYMGIKASLYEQQVMVAAFIKNAVAGSLEEFPDGFTYEFVPGTNSGYLPAGLYRIGWATEELSFDYVGRHWKPENWTYPPLPGKNNWFGSLSTSPGAEFPVRYQPRLSGLGYAGGSANFTGGIPVEEGEYRMMARGLRNGGDRNNIKDWQYFVSNWFCLEDPNINRTITPRPCNHDPEPIPTCSESIPLQMEVSIPSEGITKSPTAVASFLGYGRDSDQPAFKSIAVTLDGRLKVQTAGGDSFLYAAVAAEDPSLIYLYPEAEVTGNFSYLKCSIVDEHLVCNHGDRSVVRSCGNAPVIVFRLSKTVGEGCHEVNFPIKIRTDICIPPTATSTEVPPTSTTTPTRT